MKTAIVNGVILHQGREWHGRALIPEGGKITAMVKGAPAADRVLDAQGGYISAGWIELHTPAKVMGPAQKGRPDSGCDADVTVFDEDINVLFTVVGGEVVYNKPE